MKLTLEQKLNELFENGEVTVANLVRIQLEELKARIPGIDGDMGGQREQEKGVIDNES